MNNNTLTNMSDFNTVYMTRIFSECKGVTNE